MTADDVSPSARTRMEGGVEQLEALLTAYERLSRAIKANRRIHGEVNDVKNALAASSEAAERAEKFPELAQFLRRVARAHKDVEKRAGAVLRKMRVDVPETFEQRLDAANGHLPIIYRGQYSGSWLALAGTFYSIIFMVILVLANWALYLMTIPIVTSLAALLMTQLAKDLIVSRQLVRVGRRTLPLSSISAVVVPRVLSEPKCYLVIAHKERVAVVQSFPLLQALAEQGIEIRRE